MSDGGASDPTQRGVSPGGPFDELLPGGTPAPSSSARTPDAREPRAISVLELADRVHSAAIHLLRGLRRTDPHTGVSAAQLSVLSVLLNGPRTVGELAAAEQVRPPTMSKLLRDMQRARLVIREQDEEDGRVVRVAWTAMGASALRHGREMRISRLSREIAALTTAEQRQLAEALVTLERVSAALLSDD